MDDRRVIIGSHLLGFAVAAFVAFFVSGYFASLLWNRGPLSIISWTAAIVLTAGALWAGTMLPVLILSLKYTIAVLGMPRPNRTGLFPKCRYQLPIQGLQRCPECGRVSRWKDRRAFRGRFKWNPLPFLWRAVIVAVISQTVGTVRVHLAILQLQRIAATLPAGLSEPGSSTTTR